MSPWSEQYALRSSSGYWPSPCKGAYLLSPVVLEVLRSLVVCTQGARRIALFSGLKGFSLQEVKSKSETADRTWDKLDPLG